MQSPPATIHYSPRGYEAVFDGAKWSAVVRGCVRPDGKIIERGGPAHPDDKVIARFPLESVFSLVSPDGRTAFDQSGPVRDTFHDALLDRRDLLGQPEFRHRPQDAAERRLFAAAYDAAQKVRSKMSVLAVNRLLFSLAPSLFAFADCLARDPSGAFWLMNVGFDGRTVFDQSQSLPLAAYVLEAGGYVPSPAAVRLGVWSLLPAGPRFSEVPNDRAAARDAVISHLIKVPF